MPPEDLRKIETEIDDAFADNPLARLPFSRGVWTLLSVVEDHHYFKIAPLGPVDAAIYVDGLMNALTYPLRVCHQHAAKGTYPFKRRLIAEHYTFANKWLDAAEDYVSFCSLFPLYHAQQIEIRVQGNDIIPTDWSANDLSYEAYDRFAARGSRERKHPLNDDRIVEKIASCTRIHGKTYSVSFTRQLMDQLSMAFGSMLADRNSLPERWKFLHFSLAQFRDVFACLQCMAYAWFFARQLAAHAGVPGSTFASCLWTPEKCHLEAVLAKHTGIERHIVANVLRYLTFGRLGIRHPDIAIQPVVDLTNGQYAVSPFVLINANSERNLCVLLNQIPAERKAYSQLVDEKEREARSETIASLSGLGLDFRHGRLVNTNVDLAIVDHKMKKCLCIEIKWFIEPAEIREVLARSEELAKGVKQARKIASAFHNNDGRLMGLLGIDPSYDFLSMVGSVNFIGGHRVQQPDVPITRLRHLTDEIRTRGRLDEVFTWLRDRSYLPRKDRDYTVTEAPIKSGKWRSRWYAIGAPSTPVELREDGRP